MIAGADPADATSAPEPVPDYAAALTGDVRGARVGVPRALLDEGVDARGVARAFDAALDALVARGATLVDIELPHARRGDPGLLPGRHRRGELEPGALRRRALRLPRRRRTGRADADDLRTMYARTAGAGFGAEVKRRIMLGTYVLSAGYYDAYYLKAQQVRTLIRRDYERAFERVDVVAMPTSPTPAFRLGERRRRSAADVSRRRLHRQREPRRPAGDQRAVRLHRRRPADRPAADRPACSTRRRCSASPTPTSATRHGRTAAAPDPDAADAADWATLSRRAAARRPHVRPRAVDRGHRARAAHRRRSTRSSTRAASRPAALLAVRRVVHARRRAGRRRSRSTSRIRGSRSSSSRRCSKSKAAIAESCLRILRHEAGHAIDNAYQLRRRPTRRRLFGTPDDAVSRVLHAEAVQQELRPASRSLVRAEPSRRGLRRDLRRLARPAVDVGDALRGLAGAAQARIHGSADARARAARARRSRRSARSIRCRGCARRSREHYRKKREHYGLDHPDFYESDLRNLFSDAPAVREEPVGGALRAADPQGGRAARSPASPTATSTRSTSCSRRSSSAAAS